jgi:GTPase-associated protein 1, middle domain
MEQIYYTQCPVGYGLGASNGFQVKRLSRGYPMSGDFRHLGLKAFPGGGRTLAPPALRYRRDSEVAEVAWLTPRANEYETERGLWGRPGGHFAHGLRLDLEELKAIKRWPAGLFDSPIWVRTDREPSRGRLPEEFELAPTRLFRSPGFAEVAPLADREDPVRLARLLTALAKVTREGRTLFVIDQPDRLGPRIALLTFAFPERLRDELTFSTYHDRPEELPGYRISGTIPLARPNKPALTAQGVVADLTLGTFEPPIEPAEWARTLSGWLTRHDPVDEADWSATDARARAAKKPQGAESVWSDEWLNPLHAYPSALRSKVAPSDAVGWASLADFTGWLNRSGLAEEWVRPRDPGWWLEAAETAKDLPEARAALVSHAILRDAWRGDARPSRWGEGVATWFRDVEPSERDKSITAILQAAPKSARPSFARALLKGLTPSGAEAVLEQLRSDPAADRAMLLPLEASAAVAAILEGAEPSTLGLIVEEARTWPGATSGVLDAIEVGIADRPETMPNFAAIAAVAFDPEGPGDGREGIAWALRRGQLASPWLAPALRPVLAEPGRQSTWVAVRDRTPEELRASLARVVLAISADDGLPDEAFRWGVEGLLLTFAPRPSDPTWVEIYLKRTPSGLDLLRRLVAPEYRKLGLPAWISKARERGEVSAEQSARVDSCLEYARALTSKDPNSFLKLELPAVPPGERGKLLDQMLKHAGGASLEGLPFVLDAALQAWPGAFDPGSPSLRSLAAPLARCLMLLRLPPANWFARLTQVLEKLGLSGADNRGFEPDSLAAEVLAATTRLPEADPWALRQYLLRDELAWMLLAVDIHRDLDEVRPELAPEVLDRWDRQLTKEKPGRFFELFLNACDRPHLASIVPARAADLKTLPPLSWWDHASHAESFDDLRDGYARIVPLAPIGEGLLFRVRTWIQPPSKEGGEESRPRSLSSKGFARWRCLEALTNFQNAGREPEVRWPIVHGWEADLPLLALSSDERYRFLAWIIRGLDAAESYQLSRLAIWLKRSGMKDPARLARWAEELEGLVEVPDNLKLYRSGMIGDLRSELFRLIRDERDTKGARPQAP